MVALSNIGYSVCKYAGPTLLRAPVEVVKWGCTILLAAEIIKNTPAFGSIESIGIEIRCDRGSSGNNAKNLLKAIYILSIYTLSSTCVIAVGNVLAGRFSSLTFLKSGPMQIIFQAATWAFMLEQETRPNNVLE